jgi:hypothetical protein
MGDEVPLSAGSKLRAAAPMRCTLKLIRNGETVLTTLSKSIELEVKSKGAYRVEDWLERDGEQRPWIYSNPIYIR